MKLAKTPPWTKYTLAYWYSPPEIKPPVANSSHNSVLFRPATFRPRLNGFNRLITCRSISTNGKALLAHAIMKHNWNPMYHLQSVDDMLAYFYSIIHSLLDTYLPYVTVVNYFTDKSWITQKFRQLLRSRQHAFHCADMDSFRKFRNEAQRLAKQLRSEYYGRKMTTLPRLTLGLGGVKLANFSTNLLPHLTNTYHFPLLTAH